MDYEFVAVRVQAARAEIAARFPLKTSPPRTLEQLFGLLEGVPLDELGTWCQPLITKETDLLCDYYHWAPNTRVLLAIALVLAHREDPRCSQVLKRFFHFLPPIQQLNGLRAVIKDPIISGRLLRDRWMRALLADHRSDFESFVKTALQAGLVSVTEWVEEEKDTPLVVMILDYLFDRLPELLNQVPAHRISTRALVYLESGHLERVRNYLNSAQATHWEPAFLDGLRAYAGPPDPVGCEFYREIQDSKLWGLRDAMFRPDVMDSGLDGMRRNFWLGWLYRCQDWQARGYGARILVRPFWIQEGPDESQVFLTESPDECVQTIAADHNWSKRMQQLLTGSL